MGNPRREWRPAEAPRRICRRDPWRRDEVRAGRLPRAWEHGARRVPPQERPCQEAGAIRLCCASCWGGFRVNDGEPVSLPVSRPIVPVGYALLTQIYETV